MPQWLFKGIKFDKFLKENDAKLSRAVKKAEDERELQKVKQKVIERLKEETRLHTRMKENYIKKVAAYQKYNKFLERVRKDQLILTAAS